MAFRYLTENDNDNNVSGIGGGINAQKPKPTLGSGKFKSLQRFISANQGAGENLATRIGEGFERESNQLSSRIGEDRNTFTTQGQNELNRLNNANTLINQAVNDPRAVLADNDRKEQVKKIREGSFNRPEFTNLRDYNAKINTIGQNASNLGNEMGRFDALGRTFGNQDYSGGAKRLDQLFLQSSPTGIRNIQSRAKTEKDRVAGNLRDAQTALTDLTGQIGTLATTKKNELLDSLGQARTGVLTNVDSEVGNQTARQQAIENALRQGNFDYNEMSQYLSPEDMDGLRSTIQGQKDYLQNTINEIPTNIERRYTLGPEFAGLPTNLGTLEGDKLYGNQNYLKQYQDNYILNNLDANERRILGIGENNLNAVGIENQGTQNERGYLDYGRLQNNLNNVRTGSNYNTDTINRFLSGPRVSGYADDVSSVNEQNINDFISAYKNKTTGKDLSNYFTKNDVNRNTVVTPEQYARYAALSELAAMQNAELNDPTNRTNNPLGRFSLMNSIDSLYG